MFAFIIHNLYFSALSLLEFNIEKLILNNNSLIYDLTQLKKIKINTSGKWSYKQLKISWEIIRKMRMKQ